MGLESLTPTTYIQGLTQSWPTAGEPKSQGDDHIRLLKGVLQNTFPNATKPFQFPLCIYPHGEHILNTYSEQQHGVLQHGRRRVHCVTSCARWY